MATVFTLAELKAYDGKDPSKPILVALNGGVFDVTTGRSFYGPGGGYGALAGRDASRALAKMSLAEEDLELPADDLTAEEQQTLSDWVARFETKYPRVGTLANSRY
eukprot:c888_g1_i1.p1 GENE.c888_g1_i1~~c888_g1_i1.p1  ORF type:complete len:115 (-),score=24.26 c888_g1_i1:157-474(-)